MRSKQRPKKYEILSREVWAEIRRQYIAGTGPAELCRRFGVARSTLTTKRSVERWDEQRAAAKRLRASHIHLPRAAGSRYYDHASTVNWPLPISDKDTVQPLKTRAVGDRADGVRMDAERESRVRIGEANEAHLKLAEALRRRIDLLVAEEALGSSASARPSRDVLDAASALEKLQRVERLAIGLSDREAAARPNVVILVPPKLTPEEWQQRARPIGGRELEYQVVDPRPPTAEAGGHRGEHDV